MKYFQGYTVRELARLVEEQYPFMSEEKIREAAFALSRAILSHERTRVDNDGK